MTDNICEHPQCQQKIKGDYIVTEEGWTLHPFCRSFQYEEAYQEHQAFNKKPLCKEFFNWIKWIGGVTKKQYNENLKLHGKNHFTWEESK